MPNPIKYNSSTETNALNVGNFWIGTGDVDKGPTSVTGYYNGITPPPDGYTIYVHKANQGPSIRIASDDSELIEITNDIARASYTTITQCFNYFEGQNDKMVTHQTMNFRITDGLVLDLDGNNIPSYPHNGTTWHDLSGGGNNGTLVNGPTFNSNGYFNFDGTDDYIELGSSNTSLVQGKTEVSMGILFKLDDTASLRGLIGTLNYGCGQNLGLAAHFSSLNFYNDTGTCYSVNVGGVETGKWLYAVGTYDGTTTKVYLIKDGVLNQGSGAGTKSGATNIFSSKFRVMGPNHSYRTNGQCANAFVYNKTLTEAEVLQNYYQGPIVTDGLIRALDFSNLMSYEIGNSSGYDLTGNDTFDLFNTPTPVTDFGGGISCNNTDEFIALADKTPTDYVSVEVWFRRDTADSGENIIFNKENSWEIKEQGGNIYWAVKANNKGWFWYDSTANIAVGETIQFVLTYDGNYVKSYKNGELIQTYTYPSGGVLASQTNAYPKLNSRATNRTSPNSLGDMTYFQFRIYDRALSPDEVSKNYHATKYKFNHT